DARPFEYLVLRQQPEPWRDEDSFLVVLSMFVTLQDTDGSYESTLGTMHDVLPEQVYEFLAPKGTEWDTPVEGVAFTMPPIPGPDIYNLRAIRSGKQTAPLPPRAPRIKLPNADFQLPTNVVALLNDDRESRDAVGSNNWAVSGALTPDGHAL